MMRFLIALILAGICAAARAECRNELKSTDSYHELSAILKCLNDEIVRLKAAPGAASTGKGEPVRQSPPAPNGNLKAEIPPHIIYLTGCSRDKAKRKLTCHLSYVPEKDGMLKFRDSSTYYFDNNGDRHDCTKIKGRNLLPTQVSGEEDQQLIAGVSYQTDIEFEPANDEVQWIALLMLPLSSGGTFAKFEWRHMPIAN